MGPGGPRLDAFDLPQIEERRCRPPGRLRLLILLSIQWKVRQMPRQHSKSGKKTQDTLHSENTACAELFMRNKFPRDCEIAALRKLVLLVAVWHLPQKQTGKMWLMSGVVLIRNTREGWNCRLKKTPRTERLGQGSGSVRPRFCGSFLPFPVLES